MKTKFFSKNNQLPLLVIIVNLTLIFIPVLCFAQVSVNSNGEVYLAEKLKIYKYYGTTLQLEPSQNETGYIGVSGKSFYRVQTKTLYLDGVNHTSDERLKENFRDIDSPLEKILLLKGQKYDFKSQPSDTIGTEKEKEEKARMKINRLGFLAQEVQKVLPEVVTYEKEDDKYYLDYIAIIPVMVEAIKEQQSLIEDLTICIKKLEASGSKEKSATLDEEVPPSLEQNIPNPFSVNTTIDMYLPNDVIKAVLCIYTLNGEQIKQIAIRERGNTSVKIEGNSLNAGMYLYTLITDGKEVDTKRMILTN